MEGELGNGLIVGHAYSVTDARNVCIEFYETCVVITILKCDSCKTKVQCKNY